MLRSPLMLCAALLAACGPGYDVDGQGTGVSRQFLEAVQNKSGVAETFHTSGAIDRTNPFFLNLGTNGRTCETCHDARAAWTTSAELMKDLFESTSGTHPLFVSLHDSGNRPDADVSTLGKKRKAFETLLKNGVHRFTRAQFPATAELEVIAVDDPWGWSTPASFANFRRAGTNMGNANRIVSSTTTGVPNPTVRSQLEGLMNGATAFHAQTTVPVPIPQRVAGADFMLGLSFAQSIDKKAGPLDADGARGGPVNLSQEPFPVVGPFDLYTAWRDACADGEGGDDDDDDDDNEPNCRARERIAEGERLFNERQFDVSGVAGLNDRLGIPVLSTTCNGCHRAKNVGTGTSVNFMDIGVNDASRRAAHLPLLTVRNKTTGETRQTTELGRALSTRVWGDIGKVRVLGLRGLAARAPYFASGQAERIRDVLEFYDERFAINLSSKERKALEAFLLAL